jgi:chemotaxis protein histidine kinase CheA
MVQDDVPPTPGGPVPTSPRILTLAQAADELGVAPARVRALLANGALQPVPGHASSVAATDVDDLARRNVVRSVDVAAVEGALDRALRRRLPEVLAERLDAAMAPVAGELATALADVEQSTQRVAQAEERARTAEEALAAAETRVAELQQRVVELQMQPTGLFRRRRAAVATA